MMRLILIDDERMIRSAIARMLKAAGYSVRELSDPHDLQLESLGDYDAVITDLDMLPDFGGRDVLDHLESLGYPMRRVVLHSGSPEAASVAGRYGCHCIPKGGNLRLWLEGVERDIEIAREFVRINRRLEKLEAKHA